MSINSASITLVKGSSQYLTAAATYDYTVGTAECWVKLTTLPSATGYTYGLVSNANNSGTQGFDLVITTANKAAISFGAGSQVALGTTVLTTGVWYHIAGVWTTTDKKIHVNGILETTNSNAETHTTGSVTTYFGNQAAATTRYADIKIDDIRIWNTNVATATILANMSTELTGSESNLVGYWTLDSILTDLSVGAHTLTNNGSPAFSADVPFAGSISFSDSVTTSDTMTIGATAFITVSDSISTTDTENVRIGFNNLPRSNTTWINTSKS